MNKAGMTPLTKGGTRTAHTGKGAKSAPMDMRHSITASGATSPGATMQNYAKATPMAQPSPGLGSGTFPGIG